MILENFLRLCYKKKMNSTFSPRMPALEPLRFVLAVCVATLHFDWRLMPHAYLSAELFFMLSGFLLAAKSADKSENIKAVVIKMIRSFYHIYILSLLLFICVTPSAASLPDVVIAITMLQSMGLNDTLLNAPSWFLCCWFWSILAIRLARSYLPEPAFYGVAATVAIVSYAEIHHGTLSTGLNYSFEQSVGPFTVGSLRAIAGILAGYCIFPLLGFTKTHLNPLMGSIAEALLMVICASVMLARHPTPSRDFAFIILGGALLVALSAESGCFSRLLAHMGAMGKVSWKRLSILLFLFHYPVLTVLRRVAGAETLFNNPWPFWVLMILGALVVGYAFEACFFGIVRRARRMSM